MFNSDKRTTEGGTSYYIPLRVMSVLAFFVCLAVWLYTLFFLYTHIYTKQDDIAAMMEKTGEAVHVVDIERLEKIEQMWNNRIATGTVKLPRNIFAPKTTTAAPVVPNIEGR